MCPSQPAALPPGRSEHRPDSVLLSSWCCGFSVSHRARAAVPAWVYHCMLFPGPRRAGVLTPCLACCQRSGACTVDKSRTVCWCRGLVLCVCMSAWTTGSCVWPEAWSLPEPWMEPACPVGRPLVLLWPSGWQVPCWGLRESPGSCHRCGRWHVRPAVSAFDLNTCGSGQKP